MGKLKPGEVGCFFSALRDSDAASTGGGIVEMRDHVTGCAPCEMDIFGSTNAHSGCHVGQTEAEGLSAENMVCEVHTPTLIGPISIEPSVDSPPRTAL